MLYKVQNKKELPSEVNKMQVYFATSTKINAYGSYVMFQLHLLKSSYTKISKLRLNSLPLSGTKLTSPLVDLFTSCTK